MLGRQAKCNRHSRFYLILIVDAETAEIAFEGLPEIAQLGTLALRATLQSGQAVEVAGYRLAPALAASIDALPPLDAMPPSCPVHWFEAIAAAGQEPSPRVLQAAASWRNAGVDLHFQAVICPPFWSTSEITTSPAWLEATSAALRMGRHDD